MRVRVSLQIQDMLSKMNAQLVRNSPVPIVPCEEYTHSDLIELLSTLHSVRDPDLESIYQSDDDNRRMQAGGVKTDELATLRAEWKAEAEMLTSSPDIAPVARDGRCYDAVMWWVHHVPAAAKQSLVSSGTLRRLPLMPIPDMPHAKDRLKAPPAVSDKIFHNFETSSACSACHAVGATTGNNESKNWPDSLSYNATGYGSFPFWDNTAPGCHYCNPSVSTPSTLIVKYSATLNSELLMHSRCGDMTWTGANGAPNSTAW
jgi:hypothetical protein